MPNKIQGPEGRPVQTGTDRSVLRKGNEPAADGTAKLKVGNPDAVHITGSAKQLATLEQMLKAVPVVDDARVTRLSAAIGSGTYQVDATRVADKLLRMEELLAEPKPGK